ncbi:MAG: hypothetical protein ABJA02_04640 [Acidobacteriota bacterium]
MGLAIMPQSSLLQAFTRRPLFSLFDARSMKKTVTISVSEEMYSLIRDGYNSIFNYCSLLTIHYSLFLWYGLCS